MSSPSTSKSRSTSRVRGEAQRIEKRTRSGGERSAAKRGVENTKPTRSRSTSRAAGVGSAAVGSLGLGDVSPAGTSWVDVESAPAMTERSLGEQSGPRSDVPSPEQSGLKSPDNESNQEVSLRSGDVPPQSTLGLRARAVDVNAQILRGVSPHDDELDNKGVGVRAPTQEEITSILPEVHDREISGLDPETLRNRLREVAADSVSHRNQLREVEAERERVASELAALQRDKEHEVASWNAERERMIDDLRRLHASAGGAVEENEKIVQKNDEIIQENANLKKQMDFLARDHSKLQGLASQSDASEIGRVSAELDETKRRAEELERINQERDDQLISAVEENAELERARDETLVRALAAEKLAEQARASAADSVKAEPQSSGAGVFSSSEDRVEEAITRGLATLRMENASLQAKHREELLLLHRKIDDSDRSMHRVGNVLEKLSIQGKLHSSTDEVPIESKRASSAPAPKYQEFIPRGVSGSTTADVDVGRTFRDVKDEQYITKSERSDIV